MKDDSTFGACQCFTRLPLNILWKSVRFYGPDPSGNTAGANRGGPGLEAVAATKHGKAGMIVGRQRPSEHRAPPCFSPQARLAHARHRFQLTKLYSAV
jgi:hypothetical protein